MDPKDPFPVVKGLINEKKLLFRKFRKVLRSIFEAEAKFMPLCHSISYERVSGDLVLSVEKLKKKLSAKDSLLVKNIKISPEEFKDWEVIENLNFLNSIYARPQRFLNFRGKVEIEILISRTFLKSSKNLRQNYFLR